MPINLAFLLGSNYFGIPYKHQSIQSIHLGCQSFRHFHSEANILVFFMNTNQFGQTILVANHSSIPIQKLIFWYSL
jgi:hypothetical protein